MGKLLVSSLFSSVPSWPRGASRGQPPWLNSALSTWDPVETADLDYRELLQGNTCFCPNASLSHFHLSFVSCFEKANECFLRAPQQASFLCVVIHNQFSIAKCSRERDPCFLFTCWSRYIYPGSSVRILVGDRGECLERPFDHVHLCSLLKAPEIF